MIDTSLSLSAYSRVTVIVFLLSTPSTDAENTKVLSVYSSKVYFKVLEVAPSTTVLFWLSFFKYHL